MAETGCFQKLIEPIVSVVSHVPGHEHVEGISSLTMLFRIPRTIDRNPQLSRPSI